MNLIALFDTQQKFEFSNNRTRYLIHSRVLDTGVSRSDLIDSSSISVTTLTTRAGGELLC